jgi:alpha-1,2-glucosyltransferase
LFNLGNYSSALCNAHALRSTNTLSLIVLSYVALFCRQQIESKLYEDRHSKQIEIRSRYAAHTALNIALFPLLFFFSGLYYTDIVSTVAVMFSFLNHLSRVREPKNSILSDIVTVLLGLLTLTMRQTNVFWVVVFMGGLEAVHAVKGIRPKKAAKLPSAEIWSQSHHFIFRYAAGEIHDLPLNQAWPDGKLFGSDSFAVFG